MKDHKIVQITTAIAVDAGQPVSKTMCLDDHGNVYELVGKKLTFVASLSGKEEL